MAGGRFDILMQPNELVLIGGACLARSSSRRWGTCRPARERRREGLREQHSAARDYLTPEALTSSSPTCAATAAVALDEHIADVRKSPIFRKYPSFLRNARAVEFLLDALKQVVNGTASAEELEFMLESELETHHEEKTIPIGLLKTAGDALPGLAIVAAVLGIVTTMGHLDATPEEIGHNVAAALVGTFLGILLSYGLVQPLATKRSCRR